MTQPRSFDQHDHLFVAYSKRVARLSPDAWGRLRVRCTSLDGPSFSALLRRARLAARPWEMWLPPTSGSLAVLPVIAGASRVVQTSIAFVGQVAAEFETAEGRVHDPPRRRTHSTGKPRTDAYIDASVLIGNTLMPIERTNPGVATATRAAGQAVLRHDWLSHRDFDAVYGLMEPEIPFAELSVPSRAS
jgi:hypothetical protein